MEPGRAKDRLIALRVSEQDYLRIQMAAKVSDLSVSRWARDVLAKEAREALVRILTRTKAG